MANEAGEVHASRAASARGPDAPLAAVPGPASASGPVLDPIERLSEILFGLIMAMTFTGSIHAAQAGREDLRTILIGAIGCNLAWGLVDAVMYVLSTLVSRGHVQRTLRAFQHAKSPEDARAIADEVLPEGVIRAMKPSDYEGLRRWLDGVPESARHGSITGRTWRGAIGVFLLVTSATFPVVIPLLIFRDDPTTAIRASHGVALTMLFLIGFLLGRRAGARAWLTGVAMLLVGVLLAGMTILLGG